MMPFSLFNRLFVNLLWRTKRVWELLLSKKNVLYRRKTLMLLRMDGIGDYILFRNFIKEIKVSEKYKDYSITLCGNIVWKDIACNLDSEEINKFIWIDKTRFNYQNISYYFKRLALIHWRGHEILIHPTYSRDKIAETIVRFSGAHKKIGNYGNNTNISKDEKSVFDRNYDVLLPASNEVLFEFERNKEFVRQLIETQIKLNNPVIDFPVDTSNLKRFIVVYIDASVEKRRWHWRNYKEVCEMVLEKYDHSVYLCGSKAVTAEANEIMRLHNDRLINLVGSHSLFELIGKVSGAALVIANDTGAFHIAVAAGVKVICISNGHSFKRFHPYPYDLSDKVRMLYPREIKNHFNEALKMNDQYYDRLDLDINEIPVIDVLREIESLLK
jgi:ADP-heptose:LPS heptosyltransferase